MSGSKQIHARAARLYDANDTQALERLANRYWPKSTKTPLGKGLGEVCRYAFIRSVERGLVRQHLWRARAMAAAVICNERTTAAGLLLQAFFVATAMSADGIAADAARGHEQARLILEEIKRLVPETDAAWNRLFARLYHEKRAVSFLTEATGRKRWRAVAASRSLLQKAASEYRQALLHARDNRGKLKVRGGLALVRYLQLALDPGAAKEWQPMLDETSAVLSAATEAGYRDVAAWAKKNRSVMQRRVFVGWAPYEIV